MLPLALAACLCAAAAAAPALATLLSPAIIHTQHLAQPMTPPRSTTAPAASTGDSPSFARLLTAFDVEHGGCRASSACRVIIALARGKFYVGKDPRSASASIGKVSLNLFRRQVEDKSRPRKRRRGGVENSARQASTLRFVASVARNSIELEAGTTLAVDFIAPAWLTPDTDAYAFALSVNAGGETHHLATSEPFSVHAIKDEYKSNDIFAEKFHGGGEWEKLMTLQELRALVDPRDIIAFCESSAQIRKNCEWVLRLAIRHDGRRVTLGSLSELADVLTAIERIQVAVVGFPSEKQVTRVFFSRIEVQLALLFERIDPFDASPEGIAAAAIVYEFVVEETRKFCKTFVAMLLDRGFPSSRHVFDEILGERRTRDVRTMELREIRDLLQDIMVGIKTHIAPAWGRVHPVHGEAGEAKVILDRLGVASRVKKNDLEAMLSASDLLQLDF